MRPQYSFALPCGVLLIGFAPSVVAQRFGGSPPWGPEKPTHLTGVIHRGEAFSEPIGGGLSFGLTPFDGDWEAGISGPDNRDDYSRCATPPFYGPNNPRQVVAWHFRGDGGPGGVGQKRWIDFVLNDEDQRVQCDNLKSALQGKDTFVNRVRGRCWFTPLAVKLSDGPPDRQAIEEMKFEGECALNGALELWRLPVTYTISNSFTGWVKICFGKKGQPPLEKTGGRYHLFVSKLPTVNTSSELRQDFRGARFELKNGTVLPAHGPGQRIWGAMHGVATCGPFQSFFVGTASQYRTHASNPLLK